MRKQKQFTEEQKLQLLKSPYIEKVCRLGIPAQQKLSQQYIPPTRKFLSFFYPSLNPNPVGV